MPTCANYSWLPGLLVAAIALMVALLNLALRAATDARQERKAAEACANGAKEAISTCRLLFERQVEEHLLMLRNVEEILIQIETLVFVLTQHAGSQGGDLRSLEVVLKRAGVARRELELVRHLQAVQFGKQEDVFAGVNYLRNHGGPASIPILKGRLNKKGLPSYLEMEIARVIAELSDQKEPIVESQTGPRNT